MTPEIIRKICTRCYHYYENYNVYSERSKRMRTEFLCRSPHLGQSMVDGKNHEVSADQSHGTTPTATATATAYVEVDGDAPH